MEAFFLSLIPSFIMGTGSAFGEATILGYLRNYPKDFVAGWGSGTGLAGVSGATITLIFNIYNIKSRTMYLLISPVCFIYLLSFYIVEKLFTHYSATKTPKNELLLDEERAEAIGNSEDVVNNKSFNMENALSAFKKSSRFIVNLAAVYYLEYTVVTGFGERVANKGYITSIDVKYQYEAFSLCYQIGVFISRSSLCIVKKIKYVEIFTLIQLFNFVLWFINVYTGFISNAEISYILFIFCGLMGGASYVGCYYFLLNSSVIESDIKELCINVASMFNDFGVLLASISVLILDNTIMIIDQKSKVL
jgi:battenin